MANNNNQRTNTSTQIRNFYSDGISYLNISFFNTKLAFKFYPFLSKDNMGRSTYDLQNGLNTTVDFEGAYALHKVSQDIINGNLSEVVLSIPCAAGASLKLERKIGQNGMMDTIFSITKNNTTIEYKFHTMTLQVKENGQFITKTIESDLGAFTKTIEGYLNGINSDRHLDKLTEDYVNSIGDNSNKQNSGYNSYQNNNNGYKKNYNNGNNRGGSYRKYNNNQQFNPNNNGYNNSAPNQQNLSTYHIPN